MGDSEETTTPDNGPISRALEGPELRWPEDNDTSEEPADRRTPNPGAVFLTGLTVLPH
ncbi:hypothetical protein GIS00_21880 [Nakamurella sp. YIM 132087]|uniref:Uncharacterized protein n=1 Tax=Nakamurella alba TaxID=2665158 RepID=A0A7K1FR11_9ACTN|nr:hypothetical protein [Nakamurella alba]MTD16592.1 hypothetical protein [Nakamurella alba]